MTALHAQMHASELESVRAEAETAKERLAFLAGRNNETKAARKKQ